MGILSENIAIDLGTAYSVVASSSSDFYWRVASSIAIDKKSRQPIAFGDDAKIIDGRCNDTLEVVRPMQSGVIADFEATNQYLNHLLHQSKKKSFALNYNIFLCVPWGATAVELKSYYYSLRKRRSRIFLVREPFAAALGCRRDILGDKPSTVMDMGGGTTEIATIQGGFVLHASTLRRSGNYCDQLIQDSIRALKQFEVGLLTAEQIKISHASVWPDWDEYEFEFRGGSREKHLPDEARMHTAELRSFLEPFAMSIEWALKDHISQLSSDARRAIEAEGISLAGGTSLIRGWKNRLEARLGVAVHIPDQPMHCVIRGMHEIIRNPKRYTNILKISEQVYSS